MSTDPGFQVNAPAAKAAAAVVSFGPRSATVPLDAPPLWTTGQLIVIAIEAALVAVLFASTHLSQPQLVVTLWQHPTGMELLIGSATLLAVNFMVLLAFTMLVNRWAPPGDPEQEGRRARLHLWIVVVPGVLFYFPALVALLVGPAMVSIAISMS